MDFESFEKIAKNISSTEGLFVRFYDRAVKTSVINDSGLPVFEDRTYCEVRMKDSHDVVDQPVTEEKKKRFPLEYARYETAKKQRAEGTPLNQFAFLTVAEIATLEFHGIFTVETLSKIDDEKAKALNVVEQKSRTLKFLEANSGNSEILSFQEKDNVLTAQIEDLKEEIAGKDELIDKRDAIIAELEDKQIFLMAQIEDLKEEIAGKDEKTEVAPQAVKTKK